MKSYMIEADAPLVFRSGKPFGAGSRDGARYPWPSALAGALRTARWRQEPQSDPASLMTLTVQGPLLLRRRGDALTLMVPAPQDALALLPEGADTPGIYRLSPGEWEEGCGANMPEGLKPVVPESRAPLGKPQPMARFWALDDLLAWDADSGRVTPDMLQGSSPLDMPEVRTHVAIDEASLAAARGKLFQIQSLNFGARRTDSGFDSTTWALGVRTEEEIEDQTLTLGGERRTARLIGTPHADAAMALPAAHKVALGQANHLALTLLTPAYWRTGSQPDWLDDATLEGEHPAVPGLRLRLQAYACGRAEIFSGWDLARQAPKPSRRAMPAGSTLWFEIVERPASDDWMDQLWLASLCTGQWAKDGWGLALPRVTKFS